MESETTPAMEKPLNPASAGWENWHLKRKSGLINPLLADIIGGVSSIVAGGVTAWRLIQERAYKNVSSLYFIEDIKKIRSEYGPKIVRQIEANELTEREYFSQLEEGVKLFEGKMEERFKKGGITNIFKELKLLRPHQKWEVAISSLSASGIALGAILLLTRDLTGAQKKELMEKADGDPKRQPGLHS
ncbi:MAG: hypothetical protein KGI29_08250 [Pseudomonadota bacterium]|nr:hypothetical protein [Pseudomonadota bacterium]MDE3038691.1 hypothetical protein [Pseudomonadota bacterium]